MLRIKEKKYSEFFIFQNPVYESSGDYQSQGRVNILGYETLLLLGVFLVISWGIRVLIAKSVSRKADKE